MVRAILEGRKTQTRRIIKSQPPECVGKVFCEHFEPTSIDRHGEMQPGPEIFGAYDEDGEWGAKFPYGQPGDRLWVRETWGHTGQGVWKVADTYHAEDGHLVYRATDDVLGGWFPSIHMPRWASRILLQIVSVSVERLQDISEEDARAEGMPKLVYDADYDTFHQNEHGSYVMGFDGTWAHLYGDDSWGANPWVWVVEFKRVEA